MVALSKLEAAVLVAAAGCCKLAVSDVDESDADARLVAGAKNLQSRMLIESVADAWGKLAASDFI